MIIIWDSEVPKYRDFLEDQRMVNSYNYSKMLEYRDKLASRIKRRGLLAQGVILQQDNVCPHKAQLTRDKLRNWVERYCLIPGTIQTLCRLIFTCMEHSKTAYVEKDLSSTRDSKKRCIIGFGTNRKNRIRKLQERSDNFMNIGGLCKNPKNGS